MARDPGRKGVRETEIGGNQEANHPHFTGFTTTTSPYTSKFSWKTRVTSTRRVFHSV